jgi:hypothetical protein
LDRETAFQPDIFEWPSPEALQQFCIISSESSPWTLCLCGCEGLFAETVGLQRSVNEWPRHSVYGSKRLR